ncbi:MAG: transporter substrate-binding domain-containing protein [SAR324 cluster bacterium]|nr:transporter substrate-binding domain-containing protein [SAR324 cluster bacterium]
MNLKSIIIQRQFFIKIFILIGGITFVVFPTQAEEILIVTENFPPFQIAEKQSNGKVGGVSTEIVQAILKEVGMEATIKVYPWARAYKTAQKKKNVLIYSIGRNEERENLFKWVGTITNLKNYFYRLGSRGGIKVTSLEGAKQYITAVPRNDFRHLFLEGQGFGQKSLHIVTKTDQTVKMLFKEKVDLLIEDELAMPYQLKRLKFDPAHVAKAHFIPEASVDLYMAFSKQTSDNLVNKFKAALEKIKKEGTYDKIREKWSR